MKWRISTAALIAFAVGVELIAWGMVAADEGAVSFPANHEQGVHYATVPRGDIRQELFTSREAIAAAKENRPFPDGTVITLVDYREGTVHRYVVMEKREGWGQEFPADIRNGDWKYQVFNPDGSVKADDPERCMSCHKSRASSDYVFTVEQMRNTELD